MKMPLKKEFLAIPVLIIIAGAIWFFQYSKKPATQAGQAKFVATAAQVHDTCEAKPQPSEIYECYKQAFNADMRATDATHTLNLLDQLQHLGGYAQINCHPLAHEVGHVALHVYGSVLAASPYYTPVCYSGYYHGLLEEYLASAPDFKTGVMTACGTLDNKIYFDWFQCTHGLGHGVMQYEEDDVLKSVKDCDLLDPANSAPEICYGGVFMENITTDAKTGHPSKYIKASDPIYPCDIVATKYKTACYFLSSSMILRLNNFNFADAFKTCDTKAEKPYLYLCYQSMGRDVSGYSQRNTQQVIQLCSLGAKAMQGDCYFGAVRDYINEKGQFDTAVPMCAAIPQIYQNQCYGGIMLDLGFLKKGQDYMDVCNRLPDTYKSQCLNRRTA